MFAGCEKLTNIDFNLDGNEVNDLSYLFFECRSLQNVNMFKLIWTFNSFSYRYSKIS